MTYEQAVYFKLMLLLGDTEEYDAFLDAALVEQTPLSDIILELSLCGADNHKVLSLLNAYIGRISDAEIDYDGAVFQMVRNFLHKKYTELSSKDFADLMYRISYKVDRVHSTPWHTMFSLSCLLEDAEMGYISMDEYQKNLNAFIEDGVCLKLSVPVVKPKKSFWTEIPVISTVVQRLKERISK